MLRVDAASRYDAELKAILTRLVGADADRIRAQVNHFTNTEPEHRDEIVLRYFGREGVTRIVGRIAAQVSKNGHGPAARILDVGAGVGTFTVPLFEKIGEALPRATFYATDLTPAMLRVLSNQARHITAFVGLAEDLAGSIRIARESVRVPRTFDVVVSTLMLHHSLNTERVLSSINGVLRPKGTAVIVDMCQHRFSEFREEMADIHLGFDLERIKKLAHKCFRRANVVKLPATCRCSDTGRVADLFMLTARGENN